MVPNSILVDCYLSANDFWYNNPEIEFAQSFAGTNGILNDVYVYLSTAGTPTGSINIKIYSHSGTYGTSGIPDALLAISEPVNAGSLLGMSGWKEFTFSGANRIDLHSGSYYFLSFSRSGGDIPPDFVYIDINTVGTHSGNVVYTVDGTNWIIYNDWDIPFIVNREGVGVTKIGGVLVNNYTRSIIFT